MIFWIRFTLTLLLLSSAQAFAQVKVDGRVEDKKGNPLEYLNIRVTQNGKTVGAKTDPDGLYTIDLTAGPAIFVFRYDEATQLVREVIIPDATSYTMEKARFNFTILEEGVVEANKDKGINLLPKIDLQKQPMTGGVERYLVYTTAATSNNELTSNYNVRGGSYDENLVYVNGFQINRPFLTRSGQQEGMSFVNSALVDNVYFSAGGFQASYGDKLSSVLDITYKHPDTLHASAMASLLGVEAHVEEGIGSRFRYLFGARYRANGYLLNSLPTKGSYNPVFWDTQLLTEFDINEHWKWSFLGHVSSNTYQFAPQTQKTDFGTANEAYSFNIYFDGQENTRFLTATGGTSLKYTGKKYTSTTYLTAFGTDERETFDIQGQYYINELETDPSKKDYGDSVNVLGIGTFLNHARNRLHATIFSLYHDANYRFNEKSLLKWGAGIQQDHFEDVLSEWKMIDSAGYSVPQNTPSVDLFETIKSQLSLRNTRGHVYMQEHYDWKGRHINKVVSAVEEIDSAGVKVNRVITDTLHDVFSKWEVDIGVRALYTSYNNEGMVTPRASISFIPTKYLYHNGRFIRRSMKVRLAAGMYYQPPFYREFRTFTGELNPAVQSQKSAHFVLGTDYSFYMWKRDKPFKLTAEGYYKYLWDVNTYEIDNVRTRYFANNEAKAYAVGFDVNLHGEFIPGVQSFFKAGILSTKEDVLNDVYTNYYNKEGIKINSTLEDQKVVDSVVVHPGYIRRPTDQRFNIGVLFQDVMPGYERFSVQMGLLYGSSLPYGPPDHNRYKDTLSMKAYFRVDIGFSYDLLYKKKDITGKWYNKFTDANISFEVFNLLGVNNVLSKQWIQDVSGNYYSIPNYLTQRRFNLKLIVRI